MGSGDSFPELLWPEPEPAAAQDAATAEPAGASGVRMDEVEFPSSDSGSEFGSDDESGAGDAPGGSLSPTASSSDSGDSESSATDDDDEVSDANDTEGDGGDEGDESPSAGTRGRKRRRRGHRVDYAVLNEALFGGEGGAALAGEASDDDDWKGSPKARGSGRGRGRGRGRARGGRGGGRRGRGRHRATAPAS